MCGINGIYAYRSDERIDPRILRRTRDFMARRGPDGFGEWYSHDGDVGLGHRRLSIIDLSERAAQPMCSGDGTIVVTFNGEIYNYRALRKDLEAQGYEFQSQSDTEVLIHLYRKHGPSMVTALRGMFAFGLWDDKQQVLMLARDPYGIKPLYYNDNGRTLQFASSVKALLAGGQISQQPEPAGVVGFYVFGHVPEPFTTYRAIRSVPAGSVLLAGPAGPREPAAYSSIAGVYRGAEVQPAVPESEVQERFRAAVLDSVRHHLVADVPVGAFLSSGVDSGSLVGLMRDAGQEQIRTVTLAFDEFAGTHGDEAPGAERLAKSYGTHHVTRRIGSEEFRNDLPSIIAAMDQPSIDGINTWFVSKAAHELGLKVAISGTGGDELVGGYNTFEKVPRWTRCAGLIAGFVGADTLARVAIGAARLAGVKIHPKFRGLFTYGGSFAGAYLCARALFLPFELSSVLDDSDTIHEGLSRLDPLDYLGAALRDGPRLSFGKIATLESCFYLRNQLLRDTDWAGMAHSLEVRTPLVDYQLLRDTAPIFANRRGKISGKMLLGSSPTKPLPAEAINRAKSGFGVPVHSLLRESNSISGVAATDERLWNRTWARRVMSTQGPAGVAAKSMPLAERAAVP